MASKKTNNWNWTAVFLWSLFAALLIGLDQWTKYWIQHRMIVGDSERVTDFFNLVVAYNTGAAFSFLADAGGWQQPIFLVLALVFSVVILCLIAKNSSKPVLCFGLSLVLAGAIGNAYDRMNLGYVVDFLDFHAFNYHWPAVNVADSCICVGAFIVIIWEFFRSK